MKGVCTAIIAMIVLFSVFMIISPNKAFSEEALWKIAGIGKAEEGRELIVINGSTRDMPFVVICAKRHLQDLIKYFGVKNSSNLIGKKYFPRKNSKKVPDIIKLITRTFIEEKEVEEKEQFEQNFDPPPFKKI